MFGSDLNHGTDTNQAYPYEKPSAANKEFVPTFEDLLREAWVGIENATNTSGAKPTDDNAIATLARRLRDMLTVRRLQGNLAREEFFAVSVMAWLHVTVLFNSPVVQDLEAEASSPEDRLKKIGERVGLSASSASESYFKMAQPFSNILIQLEAGNFTTIGLAGGLYTPPVSNDTQTLVTNWSRATGRNLKARGVTVTALAARNGSYVTASSG
jgi:hypothetical protein